MRRRAIVSLLLIVLGAVAAAVAASSLGGAAPAAPAAEVGGAYTLENARVRCSVTIAGGRLKGVKLLAKQGLAALASDGDFGVEVVWAGWSAPGKINNADNYCRFTAADFTCAGVVKAEVGGVPALRLDLRGPEGIAAEMTFTLQPDAFWVRRRIRVHDPQERGHFLHALYTLDGALTESASITNRGGFGQPVALALAGGAGAFVGLEWPSADNSASDAGGIVRVRCGQEMGEVITKEGVAGEPVVMALTPDSRVKLWFDDYLDDVRAAPLRPYTLYNSWYDLRSADFPGIAPERVMNEENVLRIARLLRENMVEKHGITLDAFVLDDGWDVYESDWRLRPAQFPRGLRPIADALAPTRTRLGLWIGPTGGYSFHKERVAWMAAHGYETSGGDLWVGGPKYSSLLIRRAAEFARAGVRYYKWDGFRFLGNEPELGTPPGIYARRASLLRVQALCDSARAVDPDMFLNITSGTWLSPWWLRFADTIWMGGEDYAQADVPSLTTRDAAITYRDLVLYEDFRRDRFWFPIASLMTHGIIKGAIDVEEIGRGEPLSKFADEVVFYLARGVAMHELYISPDALSDGEWRVLADALRWARDRFPVLSHGEMIGGDPNRLEPYGYAHWNGTHGILAARNPGIMPAKLTVTLDPADGLDPAARGLVLERVYPTRWIAPRLYDAGARLELPPLLGYEAAVYELRPVAEMGGPFLADVVFEAGPTLGGTRAFDVLATGPQARVIRPEAAELPASAPAPASLERDGRPFDPTALPGLRAGCGACFLDGQVEAARDGRGFTARIKLEPSARAIEACVLLRPAGQAGSTRVGSLTPAAPATSEPAAVLKLDGQTVTPRKVAVAGKWTWLCVPVGAGQHALELALVPGADGTTWSGSASVWVTGAEAVEPVTLLLRGRFTAPAAGGQTAPGAKGAAAAGERPLPPSGLGPHELPRSAHVGDAVLGPAGAR